jgi:hypothetical protein
MSAPEVDGLDPEDAKLVTLARASRARVGAAEGAAVRDTDHRAYTAATVELSALRLSALQAAIAAAVSAGAAGLAAAAVVTERVDVDAESLRAVRELGGASVLVADPTGRVRTVIR